MEPMGLMGKYLVGDTIELYLTAEHQMNVMACTAVFCNVIDESITFTFEDVPEQVEVPDTNMKRSTTHFSEEVGIEHVTGYYALSYVELYTASGQTIRHSPSDQAMSIGEMFQIGEELDQVSWLTLSFAPPEE